MTINNGEFEADVTEVILDAMIADAKDYWDGDLNDTSLNVIRRFYEPVAKRLAESQTDIGLVLKSTQIDNAESEALDFLTALIGVTRDPAITSTGHVTFSRETPAELVYSVPQGTEVQTPSSNPQTYRTTEPAVLRLYDDFEDGDTSEYDGDLNNFSVQSTTVLRDSFSLKCDATAGVGIYRDDVTISAGADFQFDTRVETSGISITKFAYRDSNNYYQVVVDHNTNRVALEVVEDGTKSVIVEDTNTTVPPSETLTVKVRWGRLGDFSLVFLDGSDDQFEAIDGDDSTHSEGGIGFESGDNNAAKYWDFFTATATTAPIEALEPGPLGNTGRETITAIPNPPAGIEFVTNKKQTTGGSQEETDTELRQRAKDELAEGSRASAPALINSVKALDNVTSISIFEIENDTDDDLDGFELVVEGGKDEEIAQTIKDTMAAGDTSWGDINGTKVTAPAQLPSDQEETVEFSRPNPIKIYIEADLTTTDEFEGLDAVRDSIAGYIGGLFASGNDAIGLGSGDDVIYGEIEYAIREVGGIYDVSNLVVDTSDPPSGDLNITIADNEVATVDATDDSITLNEI